MRREFPEAAVELIEGSGGVFEVVLDGAGIFSKKRLGRHAQPGEVLARVRERLAG